VRQRQSKYNSLQEGDNSSDQDDHSAYNPSPARPQRTPTPSPTPEPERNSTPESSPNHRRAATRKKKGTKKATKKAAKKAGKGKAAQAQASANTLPITEELKEACTILCWALLNQRLPDRITASPVVTFLAVLGIDANRNGLLEAPEYTNKLSGLVKCGQLVVLQSALSQKRAHPEKDLLEMVGAQMFEFFAFGTASPMDKIMDLRAFGKVLRNRTTVDGHIVWNADYTRLTRKDLSFSMNSLRWWVRDSIEQGRELLADLLFVEPSAPGTPGTRYQRFPPLNLKAVYDNPKHKYPGYHFVRDEKNQAVFLRKNKLHHRVTESGSLQARMFADVGTKKWKATEVKAYAQRRYDFLSQLLLLFHITGGQPARGTELLTLTWRNPNRFGEFRNIFLEDGQVVFVTTYHKNYAMTAATKVIQRYLPTEVGELFVYYIWLVVPFMQSLHAHFEQRGVKVDMLGEAGTHLWPISMLPNNNCRMAAKAYFKAKADKEAAALAPPLPKPSTESLSSSSPSPEDANAPHEDATPSPENATQPPKDASKPAKDAPSLLEQVKLETEEPWTANYLGKVIRKSMKEGLKTEGSV
jgi:hypothetical protein